MFAADDIRTKPVKQVITSAAAGASSVLSAENIYKNNKPKKYRPQKQTTACFVVGINLFSVY